MNPRILRIELRRSVAPWAGGVVLVAALAFLLLLPGAWASDNVSWTGQWTSMAFWTRYPLFFLWPLAVGLGALQGLRDHRSAMGELLTSTPRPARHRATAVAGTMALTLVVGFGLLVAIGAVRVLAGDTTYNSLAWLPISAVGALALGAGAVLGMGVARALPSVLTPPALAVVALIANNFLRHTQSSESEVPVSGVPNALALLSPGVAEVRDTLLTLALPVHLGQTLWLLGLAVTGVGLLVAVRARARLLALVPLVAGGALALVLLPGDARDTYVVDRAAAAQVCEGEVCLTRARQARLDAWAAPGKEALRALRLTLGAQAPAGIRERVAPRALSATPERPRDAVLVDFDDPMYTAAEGKRLTRALTAQGLIPLCHPRSATESGTQEDAAAQRIAVAWTFGEELRPLEGTSYPLAGFPDPAVAVWQKFGALPRAEQQKRLGAAHTAAVSCSGDALTVLNGGALR
ncbi:hypothetical protein GCM10010329_44970 [Streptomyces spiroverticillatus]|uniref:Uncharacterized protein n=1 Tax=Streptomyces finlayi TaxID=67296 RepID=A0A918WZW1_9ACTN|nr:hypothetical protein [Streptomyces finlayi]GHA16934.1 hypothetical protein GCM10010329_44970 [Streptomyces spiroverticillatus]GHC99039.1 hypothetical protein GCM10010334_42150 [Streptomyces finlayi]